MIDVMTNQPLRVQRSLSGLPLVRVPVSQIPEISEVLTRHGIRHWESGGRYALDGVNFVTHLLFGHRGDAAQIQAALDAA